MPLPNDASVFVPFCCISMEVQIFFLFGKFRKDLVESITYCLRLFFLSNCVLNQGIALIAVVKLFRLKKREKTVVAPKPSVTFSFRM